MALFYRLSAEDGSMDSASVRPGLSGCGGAEKISAEEVFPFLADGKKHIVSIVGGGGKSTTMAFLAGEFAKRGKRTVEMTSTHILDPGPPSLVPVYRIWAEAVVSGRVAAPKERIAVGESAEIRLEEGDRSRVREMLEERWSLGLPCTVGTPVRKVGNDGAVVRKLAALPPLLQEAVLEEADEALVEADGARCLPIKAPAEHEPVILPETDVVIAVLGMNALGRPLSEVCFRPERAMAVLRDGGRPEEHTVTAEDLAALFLSEEGCRKGVGDREYYCVVNQCDDKARLKEAEKILRLLKDGGCVRAAASSHIQ